MAETALPLVLIGGGPARPRGRSPDPLFAAVIRHAGVTRPRIAYVGAASGDDRALRLRISRMLLKAGAGDVTPAPMCGRRVETAKTRRVLEDADVVFISGGDVEKGMKVVAETGMDSALKSLHRAGKPFFGLSAGSIMLAKHWVRWQDPADDASAELFPCLGLAPVLCDTHGESDGWAELQAMLSLCRPGTEGYGIVTGSALVVSADGSVSALGGEVHVFRRRKTGVTREEALTMKKGRSIEGA
jgi:cyanophycinase-like exopeptidase